ncbi:UNVERIFIED_CONTAM: U-box domain-containing protein 33 [Sesamum radiatum]|uniref:RING-type E3 ubiquitin transferase n=1 Tax=Sesamum radiatum TaxID=300843 RepID=A0AAW2VAS5_SESRA
MRAEKDCEEVEPRTTSPPLKEDMMFVALGKDVKESETVLAWALNNSRGMKICILHVHQPAQKLPMMGTKVPISLLEEHQVKAYHENERHEMSKILGKYIRLCDQAGVQAEKVCTEMDSIEKGIVQLISKHGVKWLVMGAAANKSYSSFDVGKLPQQSRNMRVYYMSGELLASYPRAMSGTREWGLGEVFSKTKRIELVTIPTKWQIHCSFNCEEKLFLLKRNYSVYLHSKEIPSLP